MTPMSTANNNIENMKVQVAPIQPPVSRDNEKKEVSSVDDVKSSGSKIDFYA